MKLLYVVVAGEALFLGGVTFGIGYTCFKYNYFAGSAFLATTFLSLHYFFRKYMFSTFGIGPSPIFPDLLIRDPKQKKLRCVCISDTHNKHEDLNLPKGDVLIHTGDFTKHGTEEETQIFKTWFKNLNFKHKVIIPGNHDCAMDPKLNSNAEFLEKEFKEFCHYLVNESVEIEGIIFHGAPQTKSVIRFDGSNDSSKFSEQSKHQPVAFTYKKSDSKRLWKELPEHIDVLLTHGPGHFRGGAILLAYMQVGDVNLGNAIEDIKPKFHIFGHIHEGYGVYQTKDTTHINAATCTLLYKAKHPAFVFDIPIVQK